MVLLLALGGVPCSVHAESTAGVVPKQDQIKAAFLYNIPKFVEWPADRFADPEAPIVIGVFSDGALRQQLETIVKERKINGRAVVIRQVSSAEEIKSAHLLFVRAEDDQKFAALGQAVRGSPVLTAGESPAFASAGGMFNFVLAGDRVRFEINMAAAERAQLKVSAQLQKLAMAIRRAP